MALSPTSSRGSSGGGGSGFPLTSNTAAGGFFLTGLGVIRRVGTVASSATPTINTDSVDLFEVTALAVNITSMTANLSGSPADGQTLWVAITDNGTSRTIAWGASFEASSSTILPTATTISTRQDVAFVYNAVTSKWRCIAVS